ncbi:AMP-binding protein [Williamsia sp. CHRR-6]|uniref:AMP-binding protein n=1 Tax=Williamsia sp. CHRR-6 TaxID=2835871 RepID=UPI001BDA69A0|nr:AMP-binding protein [Williamsia sp. CHRR-6]MBT0566842.1 AMP-binding protein [Williamsia sp. CHRR-6]
MNALHRSPNQMETVAAAIAAYPDRTAFVDLDGELTFAQAGQLVSGIAHTLAAHGVGPGDAVAILSRNRAAAWLSGLAAQFLGARTTPLLFAASESDHLYICDDAEIATLIVDSDAFAERATVLSEQVPSITKVFSLGPSDQFEDILALARVAPMSRLIPAVTDPEAIQTVLYTGGTTGRPKGVMLPQRAWTAVLQASLMDGEIAPAAHGLVAAPISHAAGNAIAPTLARGGMSVLHEGFDAHRFLRAIEEHRISYTFGVPTMLYSLLRLPEIDTTDISSLDNFIYGAALMSPASLRACMQQVGPIFSQGYGQTESLGLGTRLRKEDHDPDRPELLASAGRPHFLIDLAIQDETGSTLPAGEVGEICLRGPSVMSGYWKNPELTALTLRDGWLHTGDVGVQSPDGTVTIVDRLKDMIISGGFNVYPREVEIAIEAHTGVANAAVIGVPDEKWGEAVKAVITLKPGQLVTAAEIQELVRRQKGPINTPKLVEFVDQMPVTATGKLDKRALRSRHREPAEAKG